MRNQLDVKLAVPDRTIPWPKLKGTVAQSFHTRDETIL